MLQGIIFDDNMKHYLFIISLIIPLNVFGQIDAKIFEFENVNFDSLIVETTYPNENDFWKTVYIYENGVKVREKSFSSDTLKSYTDYSYKNGNLIIYENHNQVYSYDPEKDKYVGKIREDYYYGKEYVYDNSVRSMIIDYDVSENSKSFNYETHFQYDSNNRLEKEVLIDKYIGITGDFETNSVNLDSMYYKNTIHESYKTYEYFNDSVIIKYYENGNFSGYELYIGKFESPREIKIFSNSKELLRHEVFKRNEIGLVVVQIFKLKTGKDAWGHVIDYSMEDRIIFEYNKNRMPIKVKLYKGRQLIMTEKFKYYAL